MEVAGQAQQVSLAFDLQADIIAQGLQPSKVSLQSTSSELVLRLCLLLCHLLVSLAMLQPLLLRSALWLSSLLSLRLCPLPCCCCAFASWPCVCSASLPLCLSLPLLLPLLQLYNQCTLSTSFKGAGSSSTDLMHECAELSLQHFLQQAGLSQS